jgi:hypothetical protein
MVYFVPLAPEPVPEELEFFTSPELQPLLNSFRSIVPSLSVSTFLKSLIRLCAWPLLIVAALDGFTCFKSC